MIISQVSYRTNGPLVYTNCYVFMFPQMSLSEIEEKMRSLRDSLMKKAADV